MTQELSDKLKKSYPEILSLDEYFECGDGWFLILDDLFKAIDEYVSLHNLHDIAIEQVKEKWGGLDVHFSPYNEVIVSFTDNARKKSLCTCEDCGNTINVKLTKTSWKRSLCPVCTDKFINL